MPSYTSIINTLLRIMPGDKSADTIKSVVKLHPHSETLSNSSLTNLQLEEHTRAWLTRHAFEACRGWKWPFWLNAQVNPASGAGSGTPIGPTLTNSRARDAAAIPGLPGTFAGTMDRRAMITPAGSRFSVETWFRFGDEIIYPSQLFSNDGICFSNTASDLSFTCETSQEQLSATARARGNEDFQFIEVTSSCSPTATQASRPLTIYVSIRPYNLQAVTPLHDLVYNSKGFWMSDSRVIAWFSSRPDESWASDARHGDSAFFLSHPPERTAVRCPAGLATAISAFHFPADFAGAREVRTVIPLEPAIPRTFPFAELSESVRPHSRGHAFPDNPLAQSITITGNRTGFLLSASNQQLSSLVDIRSREMHNQFLHHNHWLVPAVRALLYQGQADHASRLLKFAGLSLQKNGYLDLAGGRWAFQGQFLTALADFYRLTRKPASNAILTYPQIRTIGRWITRKRREIAHAPAKPTGLLPPGVTRSGTGMEYQLADNIWALEGLESVSWLARLFSEHTDAELFKKDATRYANQINAAIHRELEYGLSQQVPGRLHRAFDPTSAAELLDIALLPEARRMLRADDWLTRLIDKLAEPSTTGNAANSALPGITIRNVDEQGISPARRISLCLAMLATSHPVFPQMFGEVQNMATPLHIWTQQIDPHTAMGSGQVFIDPEATALYTVMVRQLILQEIDHTIQLCPALPAELSTRGTAIRLEDHSTTHGTISAKIELDGDETTLDLDPAVQDATIDFYWHQPEAEPPATYNSSIPTSLGSAQRAKGVHTCKFRQLSNNPTS